MVEFKTRFTTENTEARSAAQRRARKNKCLKSQLSLTLSVWPNSLISKSLLGEAHSASSSSVVEIINQVHHREHRGAKRYTEKSENTRK